MKLKDYLKQLNQLAKDEPKSLELEVVAASDDEGNAFNAVYYSPCVVEDEDNPKGEVVCLN